MTLVQRETGAGVSWVNASGVEVSDDMRREVDRVGRQLATWIDETQGRSRSHLFDRTAYMAPRDPFSTIRVAREAAAHDDIVGGAVDAIEGLMFHQGFKWEADSLDQADVFNQLSRDLNLDEKIRTWNRTEITDSQVVVGMWWGTKTYTPRGVTEKGNARRKAFTMACPVAMTFLDSMRVVPLPPGPFGQDRLAWHAGREEFAAYMAMMDGSYAIDPLMSEFFAGPVTNLPSQVQRELTSWNIDPKRLIWLNPHNVFRHTRTKATYEPFAANRLKPAFPHLDLKQQLQEADRVALVGAANYILLVKKGDKDDPASQSELDNLNEGMKVLAKLPVIVGDHRLNIEIITPDQTHILDEKKYDLLDKRILAATLGSLGATESMSSREKGVIGSGLALARTLQSRRHMIQRSLEAQLAQAICDDPRNVGLFDTPPSIAWTQRNIQAISDVEFAAQVMALRSQKEISRESTLDYFGFDQATEHQRRLIEKADYDDDFGTIVPFNGAPADQGGDGGGGDVPVPPATSGAQGGRPPGGGKAAKNPAKTVRPRSGNGTGSQPSTK